MDSINGETNNRGSMWDLEQKLDQPVDEEAGKIRNMQAEKLEINSKIKTLSTPAFKICIPKSWGCDWGFGHFAYVFYNTFTRGIDDREDVIGALSLIIYSLTLIPLLKYVFIVCRANDNGQGGTFVLYSLLCRHAKVNTIPNQHRTDETLTTYSHNTFPQKSFAAATKRWLEKRAFRKNALLLIVLVDTCMAIGDGILTPAISVLSASGGIKVENLKMKVVVIVAAVILVGLFSMQHYGTDKVGWLYAPIVMLWFLFIGGIGVYNICKYDATVLQAFLPVYVYRYLRRGGKDRWASLGGIMLSITGTEALFADLGHLPVVAIQIAFTVVVFPCLLLAYCGQAVYLYNNTDHVVDAFYRSIPEIPAHSISHRKNFPHLNENRTPDTSILCHILAGVHHRYSSCNSRQSSNHISYIFYHQADISSWLVKVVHTSKKFPGQIYIPDINWILMILCIAVTVGFKNQSQIGNAYGTVKRYEFEMHSMVSMAWILGLGPSLGLVRFPGIGLVCTELASGVPHIFSHFITNLPAIHSVVVFVCVKYLPVYTVPEDERFLVKRIGPKIFHMFRCVARYGYKDKRFDNLFLFVRLESMMDGYSDSEENSLCGQQTAESRDIVLNSSGSGAQSDVDLTMTSVIRIMPVKSPQANLTVRSSGQGSSHTDVDELDFLNRCRDAGVVHILGNTTVRATRDSK
ncbi:putative potassium transporter 12 [Drosera capensis]